MFSRWWAVSPVNDVVLDGTMVPIIAPEPCEVEGCTETTPRLIGGDASMSGVIKKDGVWHRWCTVHIAEAFPEGIAR
jgi:hypothetical protein